MDRTIRHAWLASGVCVLFAAAGCARPPGTPTPNNAPVASGLTFTLRIVATPSGGDASKAASIPMQFRDGVLRVEVPSMPDSSDRHRGALAPYLLVNFTAKTSIVVMPASMQYWETRFDSATARNRKSRTVVSEIDISGDAQGNGGIVNGYPTKRYRMTTRYTEMPLSTRRGSGRKTVHLVEDIWVPDAFKDVPDPMQSTLRVFGSAAVGELVERQAEARRKLFEGMPIRATWQFTETYQDSTKASRGWTVDLLDLKRANLDRAAFRAPDGYSRIDVGDAMRAVERILNRGSDTTFRSGKRRKTP